MEDETDKVCIIHGEKRNAENVLVGKPKGRRPLGNPRCRWMNNIKMDVG
jgi:hypothetical protein